MEHTENKTIIHDTEKTASWDSNEGIRDQYSGKPFIICI